MPILSVDENTFEVWVYDWVVYHEDMFCGFVKRDVYADGECDSRHFMFYPTQTDFPLSARDLLDISDFMAKKNKGEL